MTVSKRIQKVFTKNQRFTRVTFIAMQKDLKLCLCGKSHWLLYIRETHLKNRLRRTSETFPDVR